MKESVQPVPSAFLQRLADDPALAAPELDFGDTSIAFADKSDAELRHTHRLFRAMNIPALVRVGSLIGELAVRYRLPFAERVTVATIYRQFVGGRTLQEVARATERLGRAGVLTVLDYGAEGKDDEDSYRRTQAELTRALHFAAQQPTVPVVTSKVSGLASNALLEAVSRGASLSAKQEAAYAALEERFDAVCRTAAGLEVQLYVDAEESWLQGAIDALTLQMMKRYNRARTVVFSTYQLYRHDRYVQLTSDFEACQQAGARLGAKLVRGAYMNKEGARAEEHGLPTPIHPDRASTDRDFDRAVLFCLDHLDGLAFCNASHNEASARAMVEAMAARGIVRDHPHTLFCQLYGMSDNLTYNLAAAGYRVGKYVPYGPVRDVVPYLVRRAHENTSVTGEASRELRLVEREMRRRAHPGTA